jgi:spore germination cell wall hydrolase CwlJ-like protein
MNTLYKLLFFIASVCTFGFANSLDVQTIPLKPIIIAVDSFQIKETKCLSDAIFYEASNEPLNGKLAVATVVMNRVKSKSFPKTVCTVVHQRSKKGCQFSWVCGKKRPFNDILYRKTTRIAEQVLTEGRRLQSVQNATFFHNTTVSPSWSLKFRRVGKIGNHIFYATR